MGLLNLFAKPAPALLRLPTGSFSVDRQGCVLVGTLPSSFPKELVDDIAREVIAAFSGAAAAQLPLVELTIIYPSMKIVARELRGGAMVFLSPNTPYAPEKSH
jgi:hypothetical protein